MATDTYGSNHGSGTDLDPTGVRFTGIKSLGVDLVRRLTTPRGRLSWAPDEGYDVRALLSKGITDADIPGIESAIAAEAERDDRVLSADATVTWTFSTEKLSISLAAETNDGPFTFVIAVTQLTVELLSITPGGS